MIKYIIAGLVFVGAFLYILTKGGPVEIGDSHAPSAGTSDHAAPAAAPTAVPAAAPAPAVTNAEAPKKP